MENPKRILENIEQQIFDLKITDEEIEESMYEKIKEENDRGDFETMDSEFINLFKLIKEYRPELFSKLKEDPFHLWQIYAVEASK